MRGRHIVQLLVSVVIIGCVVANAGAAEYGIESLFTTVQPGQVVNLHVNVITEVGDNLVGVGHYSFAIDLLLGGTAGAMGGDISGAAINELFFDDLGSNHIGVPSGNSFVGTGGATTDVTPPNYGSQVGDELWLFDFDLAVPPTAQLGETITITPSEGFLENVTVGGDLVSPQHFSGLTLTIVPEATSLTGLLLGLCLLRSTRFSFNRRCLPSFR